MFNFRYLIFIFALFSNFAFADDFYYWTAEGFSGKANSSVEIKAWFEKGGCVPSSGAVSCEFSYPPFRGSDVNFSLCRVHTHSNGYKDNSCPSVAVRHGSSCPANSFYNKETGACDSQCIKDEIKTGFFPTQKFGDFHVTLAPQSACIAGCGFDNVAMSGGGCIPTTTGIQCTAHYSGTGEKCIPSEEIPEYVEPTPAPDEPDDNGEMAKDCEKIVQSDGSILFDCRPNPVDEKCPAGWALGADGSTCYKVDPDPKDPDPTDPKDPKPTDPKDPDPTDPKAPKPTDPKDPEQGTGGGSGGNGGTGGGSGGGSGNGNSGSDGDGTGSGESVENCESGRCDFGSDRDDPFDGEVRSFSDSLSAVMDGMKNSPIGNSVGQIKFPSGGKCPVGKISLETPFGSIPLTFESHCALWLQIEPILSAVFLAFWALLAVRVFLSA